MFSRPIKLFTLFGFAVRVDASWFAVAALITWSLRWTFPDPDFCPGLASATYWWMGLAGAAGLFASIVIHELAHSVMARAFGLTMRGITLFIFGGVAEMEGEPPNPLAEFMVAVAGPLASVLLALACAAFAMAGNLAEWPVPITGVLGYLAIINALLVAFNLIPAFPLDGGRVLRSILWSITGSLHWATRIASWFGSAFGVLLIVAGVYSMIWGDFVGGIWWFVLGIFLRGAARMSYRQVLFRHVLEGQSVSRLMQPDVRTVGPEISIEQLVSDHVYRHHFKMFPVTEGDTLLGCITTRRIQSVPRNEWAYRTVAGLVEPCSEHNVVAPSTDAMDALWRMNRNGTSRLMVAEEGRLCGVVSLKDMLKFISLKLELEGKGR